MARDEIRKKLEREDGQSIANTDIRIGDNAITRVRDKAWNGESSFRSPSHRRSRTKSSTFSTSVTADGCRFLRRSRDSTISVERYGLTICNDAAYDEPNAVRRGVVEVVAVVAVAAAGA